MPEKATLDFVSPNDSARPQVPHKRRRLHLPNYLRDDEFEAIVAAAQKAVDCATSRRWKLRALRDRLILHLGLYCGLRVSELCRLRVENIDLNAGNLTVIQGKGGKDRCLPIHPNLLRLLKEWIGPVNYGWLMHGECGWHVGHRTVQERLKIMARQAGITRIKVKPHTLRHSAGTRLLNAGADINTVKEFLGHASLGSTEVYLHVDPSRMRSFVSRM